MIRTKPVFYETRKKLIPLYGKEAESLSYMIMEEILNISRIDIIMNKEIPLSREQEDKLDEVINRLKKMEPVQYILGKAPFLDRIFEVRPGILIPRQETEELVQLVKRINDHPGPEILDIGCGSGCIAISLALEIPKARVSAWDISSTALEIAERNARRLEAEIRIETVDIFSDNIPGKEVNLIVSNPPYVLLSEKKEMSKKVIAYEPHEALFVQNSDPLRYYKRILEIARSILINKGLLFFEINEKYGESIQNLMRSENFDPVRIEKDIHDKDRFIWGKKSGRGL